MRVNPDTDISTFSHEYQHFFDDRAQGFPGMGFYFENPEVRIEMERTAYNVEINRALQEGYDGLAELLRQALGEQIQEIISNFGL